MPHPQILAPLRTWLLSLGVEQPTATQAAQTLAVRLELGHGLKADEQQLILAYLNRANASPAADAQLKAIVEWQKTFPVPETPTPGPGPRPPIPFPIVSVPPKGGTQARRPAHTPEWINQRPGDPGHTLAMGYDLSHRLNRGRHGYVPQNNQSDLQFIRSLAKRVGGY